MSFELQALKSAELRSLKGKIDAEETRRADALRGYVQALPYKEALDLVQQSLQTTGHAFAAMFRHAALSKRGLSVMRVLQSSSVTWVLAVPVNAADYGKAVWVEFEIQAGGKKPRRSLRKVYDEGEVRAFLLKPDYRAAVERAARGANHAGIDWPGDDAKEAGKQG